MNNLCKTLLLLTTFCFSIANTSAQLSELSLLEGEVFKDEKKKMDLAFTAPDGKGGVFTVRAYYGGVIKAQQGYYIDHFDSEMNLIGQYDLEMKLSSKLPGYILGISVSQEKLNLVTMRYDRKAKEFQYSVLSTGIDKFAFEEKRLLTFKKREIVYQFISTGVPQNQSETSGEIGRVIFSENKNYAAIMLRVRDEQNYKKDVIYVFDDAFEKIYSINLTDDIPEIQGYYQDYIVDDTNGELFFLMKKYGEKENKDTPNYHFEIFKLGKDIVPKWLSFSTEDRFIGSLRMIYRNGRLSCVGYFSEKKDFRYKGVTRINIDPFKMEATLKVFKPFSEQFLIDRFARLKDKELKFIKLVRVFMDNEGTVFINGEERYVTQKWWQNTYVVTGHHYNDVLVSSINLDGSRSWSRNINKQQKANVNKQFDYLSFGSIIYNGYNYVILNGPEAPREIRKGRIKFGQTFITENNLYVIKFDKNGDFEYQKVLSNEDTGFSYHVLNTTTLSAAGEAYISGSKGKNKRMLKITF